VWEKRNAPRVFVVKPEGKRPRGRRRHEWGDNIKMDLKKLNGSAWNGLIWLKVGVNGSLF
jgi:hypothetical protein